MKMLEESKSSLDAANQGLQLGYSWSTYLLVALLSVWAGVLNFVRKVRAGLRPSFTELIGEIVVSGFVGLLTFYASEAAGFEDRLQAVLIGIAAHMGARGIFLLEKAINEKVKITTGVDLHLGESENGMQGQEEKGEVK